MINIASIVFFSYLLTLIQVSFLTTWPVPISSLNLVFCVVLFITVMIGYEKGLVWSFFSGLFLSLYSAFPFGSVFLSMVFSVVITDILYKNFFTNRSLYSLAILGFIGTIIYNLILLLLNALFTVFGFSFSFAFYDIGLLYLWQPIMNVVILWTIFFIYFTTSGRIKNYFHFSGQLYEKRRHP